MAPETNSSEPTPVIEQEMQTIIFYLTAFGHIDGSFDASERAYIRTFIDRLVAYRTRLATPDADPALRASLTAQWTKHFQEVFDEIDQVVEGYFTESVGDGEDAKQFVFARLKLRCYELFRQFSPENQSKLLMLADELMAADGEVHPNEARFRQELSELLATEEPAELQYEGDDADEAPEVSLDEPEHGTFVLDSPRSVSPRVDDYPFFAAFEQPYVKDKQAFAVQAAGDLTIIEKTMAAWDAQRAQGAGKLGDAKQVADLAGRGSFLDGHVYVLQPPADQELELLVLGDLHGCYSCLKGALMQADFFAKVDAHHHDPVNYPAMKLVLLGDYIDRGRYSYNGVLRTVMQLYLTVPEHVYVLRGNHEFYVEVNGRIYGGVRPAEAIESLQGLADVEVFKAYKKLFEAMPCSLLLGKMLFAHAGIPRDDTMAAKWTGLNTLNDAEVRFQMLWSDPSEADFVPADLQAANARFPFGRHQFRHFMERIGCNMMIRGHERVEEGIRPIYKDADATLLTLFSAGGRTNEDLPPTSNYRAVTPMALTMRYKNGVATMSPFAIDYARYNKPEYNGFLRPVAASP